MEPEALDWGSRLDPWAGTLDLKPGTLGFNARALVVKAGSLEA